MTPTPITPNQWQKVVKALYYSFSSGFVGGFTLAITNALTSLTSGGHIDFGQAFAIGLLVAGVVGGLNTLAVTIKQLFTPSGE